jgi:kynureninase
MTGARLRGERASGGAAVRAGSRDEAQALDERDPLAEFRERFILDQHAIYLDGNSLGCLPRTTPGRLEGLVREQWGRRGVRGWEEGWLELPLEVGERLAAAALGAGPGQVVIGDSTTVCFYKLACAALEARSGRREIVTDLDNFPTDRYVLEGIARARGLEIKWLRFDPAAGPTAAAVASAIGPQTALITFSHVSYRSAHIAELAGITALAREAGALALWDLSHSAGSVPLALDADGVELAVGCTYKYLHGGPGAPAYMYIGSALQEQLRQPIWGWLGRRDPFEMAPGYIPAEGLRSFLSGTPPVLALTAVDEGVRVVAGAGMGSIRAKGVELTELAIALADERLGRLGVSVASPREAERRGAHVALAHPEARPLCARLIERGVIVDFRRPDVIRLGLAPLTTRFIDVWDGIEALRALLAGN